MQWDHAIECLVGKKDGIQIAGVVQLHYSDPEKRAECQVTPEQARWIACNAQMHCVFEV